MQQFIPITLKEIQDRGWDYVDIIIVSGDAYVDHPSFGSAVIARTLEAKGYRVAILPQPNWQDDLRDFKKLGKPRLFFGISSGCMDSMVNHYTANKRLRSNDAYTPGGKSGFRPDYATVTYSNILKKLYPETPVIIGGIEASMRRLAHYDYWSDSLKPSILVESKADILVYGMGEKVITEIADRLSNGETTEQLQQLMQIGFVTKQIPNSSFKTRELHNFSLCLKDKAKHIENFKHIEINSNSLISERLIQKTEEKYVIINPPDVSFSSKDLDESFALPYTRKPHPKYRKRGDIPAYEMIKYSINTHRGCFGGCSFCTISAHQGKHVISRSEESILQEIGIVTSDSDFKGYLSDLGGPSANMYKMEGINKELCTKCSRYSCIYPSHCKNLNSQHKPIVNLYRKAAKLPHIKKVFIGSGIRYDLFTNQNGGDLYFEEVVKNHVSGRLKVAPEHTSDNVLKTMRKPSFSQFIQIKKKFDEINKKQNLRQQLIPYFISSHPSCTLEDMASLALEMKNLNYRLEQVQDFTPTPMTLSTEMYYTGIDPYTLQKIYCAKDEKTKREQSKMFFWYKPEYKAEILKSLRKLQKGSYYIAQIFNKR